MLFGYELYPAALAAPDILFGKEFLNGHGLAEIGITRLVGDTERAGPKYGVNAIFLDECPEGQRMRAIASQGVFDLLLPRRLGLSVKGCAITSGAYVATRSPR